MPSPYLSRIKLEKELEKRAREIKEKREKSEKLLNTIDNGLEMLKDFADVKQYREKLETARKAFTVKDFDKALGILEPMYNELSEKAKKIFDSKEQKILELLSSGKIEDSAKIKANMDEARSKLSSNFVESLKIMEEINTQISSSLKDLVEKRRRELLAKISGIEGIDDIRKRIEELEGSSLDILDTLDSIEEDIKKKVRAMVEKKLVEADKLIGIAKSAHYNLPVDEDKKNEALEYLNKEDFLNAINASNEYLTASRNSFKLFFTKIFDISKILISEGRAMGENMDAPNEILEKAQKAYTEEKLEEAVNLVRKATEEAEKIKLRKVMDIIKVARDKLLDAKKSGIEIGPYLAMIENARNFIKIGKHKKAYDTVLNALNLLERKMNLYSQLKNEIKDLKETLDELTKEDIILEGVEDKLSEIETKVDENPEEAEKMVDDLKKLITFNIRDIATSLHQELSRIITKGEEVNIELGDIKVELESISKILEEENYKDSIIALRKIEEKLYSKIFEFIKKRISEFEKYEENEIKRGIDELKMYIDSGDIDKSLDTLKKVEESVFKIESGRYKSKIKDLEKKIEFLKDLDEDTSKIDEYINSAKGALEKMDLERVGKYLEDANSLIETLSKSIAQRAYESVKEAIEEASSAGIDLDKNGISELMNEVERALEGKNYQEVLQNTSEIKNKIKEIRARMAKIEELKEKLKNRINELGDRGIDIRELENMLNEIENKIKDNQFDAAENTIKEAFKKADFVELRARVEALREEIENLGRIMRDFNERKKYLTITENFFMRYRKGEYDGLVEEGSRIIEELKKSVEDIFNNYLGKLGRMIGDLEDMGAKIDPTPLREGKERFWAGDITGAFKLLQDFENDIKRMHGEKMAIQEMEERISTLLTLISTLGLDAQPYAKRATEIGKIENSEKKKEMLTKLINEMDEKIREKMDEILRSVENELEKMRRMGEDITAAEGMVAKAKNMMGEGKYKDAFYQIFGAMEEMENLEMQKSTAYNMLKMIEKKINSMRGLLPPEIIKDYKNARTLFLNELFRDSINKILAVSEQLWEIERIIQIIKERNAKIKVYIEQAKKMGIDMKNVLLSLAKAKKELQELHYDTALKFVNEAYKEARRAIDNVKGNYRERYEPLIKMLIDFELRDKFEDIVKEIDDAFTNDRISKLDSLIENLKKKINEELSNRLDLLMKDFDERKAFIENSPLKGKLNLDDERARLEKMRKDPYAFVEYYTEVMEKINSLLPEILRVHIDNFVNMAKEYEKLGVNVSDYIERAGNLRNEVDDKDYKEVMRVLDDLRKNFELYIEEYAKEKMERTVAMVEKHNKKKAEEFKLQMKNMLNEKKYAEVIKLADEAIDYVGNYRSQIERFNTKAIDLKNLIKHALSLGINMDKHIKSLKDILSSPEDLEDAINKMDDLANEIRKDIDKIKPEIKVTLVDVRRVNERYMAKLSIKNEGSAEAKNITITLDGALKTEKPIAIVKIPKSSEEFMEVFLLRGEGKKIEGRVKYQRFDDKEYEEKFELEFKLEHKGFHIEKNKEKVKCTLCRGTILPGLDILVCDNCGAVYHLPCAKRAGKCLKCGTPFNFQ